MISIAAVFSGVFFLVAVFMITECLKDTDKNRDLILGITSILLISNITAYLAGQVNVEDRIAKGQYHCSLDKNYEARCVVPKGDDHDKR